MSEQVEKIGIREFARRVGVSDTAVHKARKTGKISEACFDFTNPKRPQIYPEAALREWGRNYAPNWQQSEKLSAAIIDATDKEPGKEKKLRHSQQQAQQLAYNDEGEIVEDDAIQLSRDAPFVEAKRVEAIAKAKLATIEVEEARGRLVSKEKVYRNFYDVGVRVRSALQNLPDKIIDNLRACETRSEAHALLYSEITQALEALSNPEASDDSE